MKRMATWLAVLALVVGLVGTTAADVLAASDYPNRPITMIVPWTAGGTSDQTARMLASIAERELGQPITVENRPGAGSIVGTAQLARSRPDGYTIGLMSVTYLRVPHQRDVPYDALNDFDHILKYGDNMIGVVVPTDSPWETLEDLIEDARANPGKYKFGTGGVGTSQHMTFEAILAEEGVEMLHVPYAGGSEALPAVLGGHVDVMSETSVWAPHVASGDLRLLATYTRERTEFYPDVPSLFELGYTTYFPSPQSFAVPAGTPEEIRAKLEDAFRKAMEDPQFIDLARRLDFIIDYMSGDEFAEWSRQQYEDSRVMMEALGMAK